MSTRHGSRDLRGASVDVEDKSSVGMPFRDAFTCMCGMTRFSAVSALARTGVLKREREPKPVFGEVCTDTA